MKKIKNLGQLREQKAILAARQLQAEKNIRLHWNNLKEELRPVNLTNDAFNKIAGKTEQENILKSTFTYGLSLLSQKIADAAEGKIKKILKK